MVIGNQAKTHPPTICAALTEKRCQPEAVLEHIGEGDDVIVGMFNSEPLMVLDALEASAERLSDVGIHQIFPYRERRYMHGSSPGLRHVSWFLSPANREARGSSIRERARKLTGVAHPTFRDELERKAREMDYL